MKTHSDVRKCYRARYNQVRRIANELCVFTETNPDDITGVEIADMRTSVEELTQAMHEFSAYWNVAKTGKAIAAEKDTAP